MNLLKTDSRYARKLFRIHLSNLAAPLDFSLYQRKPANAMAALNSVIRAFKPSHLGS